MKVLVAGATGAVGRPLVAQLVERGHEVAGMTRSQSRAEQVRAAGAQPVVCDVFDSEGVRAAIGEFAPQVVVHQLTALPEKFDLRDEEATYSGTARLRGEGTRILIEAALAAGARRMVAQSIAFMYAPQGDWVKEETAALLEDAPGGFGEAERATRELEQRVTGTEGLDGVVLRYGFFYGPGTYYAPGGSQYKDVRRWMFPVVGKGLGTFSFVHVDDAAAATVLAVEGDQTGIYNVCDDEPAPLREWLPVYAKAIGARRPLWAPTWLAGLVAGRQAAQFATTLRGASNAKARRELGWQPRYPSWRTGFGEALDR